MRGVFMSLIEPILYLFIIANTLLFFLMFGWSGSAIDSITNFGLFGPGLGQIGFNIGWALVGGLFGFLFSAAGFGPIFVLLTIKDLLEEQLDALEALSQRIP